MKLNKRYKYNKKLPLFVLGHTIFENISIKIKVNFSKYIYCYVL